MIISCQKCGARFKIRDDLVTDGPKRAKCKKCGGPILIKPPDREASVSSALESSPASQISSPEVKQSPAEVKGETPEKKGETPEVKEPVSSQDKKATPEAETSESPSKQDAGTDKSTEPPAESSVEEKTTAPPKAPDTESIMIKMEKRRQKMEDEISGRLNKAALDTLDLESLEFLAKKIISIEENPDYEAEKNTQLFSCINCKAIFALFPEDSRVCTNCPGEVPLVRGEDLNKQYSMFNR